MQASVDLGKFEITSGEWNVCATQQDGIQSRTLGPVQCFRPETLEDRREGDLLCVENKYLAKQGHV